MFFYVAHNVTGVRKGNSIRFRIYIFHSNVLIKEEVKYRILLKLLEYEFLMNL